jgi:hypothetical protein
MGDISSYTPLKTVVAYALDECKKSNAERDRAWLFGLRAMVDMLFDVSGQAKTVRIPVIGNQTAPFPMDCLSWSKIGILDDKGQINSLKINNALTTYRDDNANRLSYLTGDISDTVSSLSTTPYYSNYYYNGGVHQLYGVGNGVITYGECRVDEANRIVVLEPNFRYDSIMFEYISNPEMDEDYQIPTCLQEAVIAFIKWKFKMATPQDYYAEVIKGRRRLPNKKFVLQTFNQVIRESDGFKLRS